MTRSSEDIEREVESARDDLDRTVDALKEKMSPGQMIDEISRSFKGGGAGEMMGNLGAQVRENPMALAMIGAGMAWLMMGKSTHPSGDGAATAYQSGQPTPYDASPPSTGLSEAAGGVADKVGHAAASAKDALAGAASKTKDALGDAADHAVAGAHGLGDQAGAAGRKAARTFEDILQQEPLIIGALGLAVGVAVGAALPSTPLEDRTFGAARDDLMKAGGDKLVAAASNLRASGEAALEAAKAEADNQGLSGEGGSLVEKAEAVVRSSVDAAKDELGASRPV
ncbi:DUF3618 domain-containing protein [Phenylobacterium sp. LjRoot164]|uniref:DUF3618 domain-containing protein n=1 Tax=unclassified Phenylobacterium TaxID=2640670 RepID=UPI003ECD027E